MDPRKHARTGADPDPAPADPEGGSARRSSHWLVRIVERAGLAEDDPPAVPAGAPARDVWGAVSRSLGLAEDELVRAVADYFRLDVADLTSADPEAAALIPEALARKHFIYALAETDRQIVVATCDPTDVEAERAAGFTTGRTAVFQVAPPRQIEAAIDARFAPDTAVENLLGNLETDGIDEDAVRLVEEMGPEEITEDDIRAGPVVKLTNLILRQGISEGASDIHIEPGRRIGVVRYRIDGVLRKHMDLPMSAMNRVISRIKILSKLDIADRLRPQDGKARVRIEGGAYDLRVSTLPAGGAEKCVIRILDSSASFGLDDLDIPEVELDRLRQLLSYREGILVVTGPTGSGKTTTLYAALRELADGKINITTVEDPIEYELSSVTQTQVQPRQGLTFAKALRSILRQDPDVILVGEIRDPETAHVAAQAAMTGHLVLATVHANDAVSAVPRLADLELQHSMIAQTLRGALAQRLLRRACPACAEPVGGELTPEEQHLTRRHGIEPVVRAVGCPECAFTGYKGRLPVVEVMTAGPRMQTAVEEGKGWATLTRVATQGGMRTMHEVAQDWVVQGRTTIVEIERVLGQVLDEPEQTADDGPGRVLVVDDDPDARLLLRTALEDEGYEVEEVDDGSRAVELLEEDVGFDLVVLDLALPELDGWETLKWIRGHVPTAALPVIVRTGRGTDEMEAELLRAGADDYVAKSVDVDRFLARVDAVIRRTRV